MRLLTLLLALAPLSAAWADEDANAARSRFICEEALGVQKGSVRVHGDGLSTAYAEQGQREAEEAREVLNKLGVPTPPHQIIFAPEQQLNVLAATGTLPMPHALSGADIYRALSSGSTLGILEFAQPGGAPLPHAGCATCRSYYSNMTAIRDQRPIYFHVGGHNHVFQRSLVAQARNIDPIAASSIMADDMEKQYEKHGPEPISLFYHYLAATMQLQDFIGGTFVSPAKLTPKESAAKEVTVKMEGGNWGFLAPEKKVKEAPWVKTPSVLQFLSANLPPHITDYKREMLEKYEMTVRTYPSVGVQQFVHEGWATFLMMLGQKHSNWTSDRDVFDFARIVAGAVGKQLNVQQPYSFGVHGFHHLYMKFKRRPEIQGLTELAQDVKFVEYVDGLLPTMMNAQFINLVVDEEFVNRHNLALLRGGLPEELGPIHEKLKAKGVPDDQLPNAVIISKSADRLRKAIMRRVGVKQFPQMQVVNPAVTNPFQVNLEQKNLEGRPLEPVSAAQVFFAMTQVTEMPVSATILISSRHFSEDQPYTTVPVRMEVRPDGKVRVFKRSTLDSLAKDVLEEELPQDAAQLEAAIDYYRTDQSFSFSDQMVEEDRQRWEQMFPRMISEDVAKANTEKLEGLVDYAPAAARAIILFGQLIQNRFAKQMDAAFQGKLRLKFGPNGVKLPLIPMTPQLQYDQEHIQAMNALIPPAPMDTIDQRLANMKVAMDINADDGSMLGPVPGGSVGDAIKVPGGGGSQKKSAKGEGGEDSEQDISIPPELYRRLLAMHFDIPNPRRTEGETPMVREIKMGERRDSSEEPLWEKMAADALVKAIVARKAKGEPNPFHTTSATQLIREGFGMLDEDDYIIRSRREVPIPSFDAVVVVNVDISGSMQGHRMDLAKNAVYNVRELFRAVYPNVKFHFVGHNDKAKEYSEEDLWKANPGGGTMMYPALEKTGEILEQYPLGQWNHYVMFIGDSELGDLQKFMQEFKERSKKWQWAGFIISRDEGDPEGIDSGGLRAALAEFKNQWKWIGVTQMNGEEEIFRGLGELFPKTSN